MDTFHYYFILVAINVPRAKKTSVDFDRKLHSFISKSQQADLHENI